MTIQDALKKSIERGFVHGGVNDERNDDEKIRAFVLLPQFWQCLGKAMGWDEKNIQQDIIIQDGKAQILVSWGWKLRMFRFINHLASGKSAEEFFEELK